MSRTRSAAAHRKVLDAALELIAERGVDGTSMDAIAERSGVSKATIYKHWADKDALLLEVMADINGLGARPGFDTGNTRRDMVEVLAYRPPDQGESRSRVMPKLCAYSAQNKEFGLAWRKMVMDPPRRELTDLIRLGMRKRELQPLLDIDLCLALLLGPMLYSYIFSRNPAEDTRPLAEGVVRSFWRAFGIPPRASNAPEKKPRIQSAGPIPEEGNPHQRATPRP